MNHIIDFNQSMTKRLPKELINDLKKIFKEIYKEDYEHLFLPLGRNKEEYIYYFKNRYYYELSYNENFFENQIIIEQLDESGLLFHFPDFSFIVNKSIKNDFIVSNNIDYNYILLTIIMLCVKHNIIKNNWISSIEIDSYILYEYGDYYINDYYNLLIQKCKNTLYKIGYKQFNCNINENYWFNLKLE